jgi:hypothetical protein
MSKKGVNTKNLGQPCLAQPCDRPSARKGWCDYHYMVAYNHNGDPYFETRKSAPSGTWKGVKCAHPPCEREAVCRGYCNTCDQNIRHHGTPDVELRKPRDAHKIGENEWIDSLGYVATKVNGKRYGAHRKIVADYLGIEKLPSNQQVHHRDKVRHNNTVGPCVRKSTCDCPEWHNLELWDDGPQPTGARVGDLVKVYKRYIFENQTTEELEQYIRDLQALVQSRK